MREETQTIIDNLLFGLSLKTNDLYLALVGSELSYTKKYKQNGPFIKSLERLAAIYDGGEIKDYDAIQEDVYNTLKITDCLANRFQNIAHQFLTNVRQHIIPKENLLTYEQAGDILHCRVSLIEVDVRCSILHPIVFEVGESYKFFLDRYEVESVRSLRERNKKTMEEFKSQKESEQVGQQ